MVLLLWSVIVVMSILLRPVACFIPRNLLDRTSSHVFMMVASDATSSFTTRASNEIDMVLDPLVVCGPSGVGKGTIIEKYMNEHGGNNKFGFTVSHTTRLPRPGEQDGIHYHYTNLETMRQEILNGSFLEHAEVHGNLYGTSWNSMKAVQLSGKHCLLDIDTQGVQRLKSLENALLQPKYIFIAPPSMEILQQRLADRGTESAESLERRTENARAEVEYGVEPGNFDYIVVNNDLDDAVRDFANAVNDAYPDTAR